MASLEAIYQRFLTKVDNLDRLDSNGQSGFAREFMSLRQTSMTYKSDKDYSTEAGQSAVNKVKNRFKDILPFDSTRVKLASTGITASDYINANHIKGINNTRVYIASQGPLPNTVNDFWQMLWMFKIKVVVMLCRQNENGKKKCQQYWPKDTEEKLKFGGISVKTKKSVAVGDNFTMRTLVAECEGEELMLTQFHYTAWPDHGVPTTTAPMIELLKLVRDYQPDDNTPIMFHCSAGCGRTGTICALDYAYSLLKQTRAEEIDPYEIVHNLRKQRPAMVQTKGQYEYMCRAMCALFRERLKLPIEEEMEDHLYENVSKQNYSDSDSEACLSPAVMITPDPFQSKSNKKSPLFIPPAWQPSGLNGGQQKPPVSPKRMGQLTQTGPSDSYVNVSMNDLIDLSDNAATTTNNGNATRTNGGRGGKSQNSPRKEFSKLPEKSDLVSGYKGKPTMVKQDDCDEYVIPNRPMNPGISGHIGGAPLKGYVDKEERKSPTVRQTNNYFESDETSDYVFASVRGNQSPPGTINSAVLNKRKNKMNTRGGQSYENVPAVQHIPKGQNGPPSTVNSNKYENVEDPGGSKPENPERKPAIPVAPRPQERTTKPVIASAKPEHSRRKSSSLDDQKASTCGPSVGKSMSLEVQKPTSPKPATCGARTGVHISSALNRAGVLPNQQASGDNNEEQWKHKFCEDVDSELYAPVKRRNKPSNRSQINDHTFKHLDSVDGDHPPEVPKKSPDIFLNDEQHDSNNEAKNKALSLTHKFSFLSKKPEHEAKVFQLGNIGYGIRLGKPKGPRNPPKSWMVKS